MLSQEVIKIVKSTAPVLEKNGVLLTKHFYQKLFDNNPEVLPFFNRVNQKKGTQATALARAICAYAKNIDNLGALKGAVEMISHKHFSLKVKPEHYPIVGVNLLESIKDVLGDAATPEIVDAWSQAYFFLADILIEAEKSLANNEKSYDDFKKFKVIDKVKESETITSFYLSPSDQKLPKYLPGQYITVRVPCDGRTTMRNYSLSTFGFNDHLRISVKREDGLAGNTPSGHVSNFLHKEVIKDDEIELGAPAGVFTLNPNQSPKKITLLAGGIGITPLLAMTYALLEASKSSSSINLVHANQNEQVQPFRAEIDKLASKHQNIKATYFYDSLEREKSDQEYLGHVSKNHLKSLITDDSVFYICGPKLFMSSMVNNLKDLGVDDDRVHFEFFGPLESI